MSSSLVVSTISNFRDFYFKEAQKEDDARKRFKSLAGLLEMPAKEKEAAKEDEEEREKAKQERLRGGKGLQKAFGRSFRDLIEDFLPGGYFTWNEYARDLSNDFYRRSYAQINKTLPKRLSEKLKGDKITDVPASEIKLDPETTNKIITDMVLYFHEHPQDIKDVLIKSFSKRERAEDEVPGKKSEIGVARTFFVPRINEKAYNKLKAEAKKEGEELKVKPGDPDEKVLNSLEKGDTIEWKWKGIDERGILHFTLPNLFGSRVFTTKLPSDIKNIRSGTYTFKVHDVTDRGAILEFVEQRKDIHEDTLESIEESGLGKDQLSNLIDAMVDKYTWILDKMGTEKLIEDLAGKITLRGEQVGSVEDIVELKELGKIPKVKKLLRGEEKIEKARREKLEERQKKIKSVIDRWGPDLAQYFLSMPEDMGQNIVKAVAEQYPEHPEKKVPSLQSILQTRPVVEMVMRTIISPATPLSSGKSDPWARIAGENFKKMAVQNPSVKIDMQNLIRSDIAKKKLKAGEKVDPRDIEVTGKDIRDYLENLSSVHYINHWTRLKESLQKTIMDMKNHPALKKFFDRKRYWESYIRKDLESFIEGKLEEEPVEIDEKKGKKALERWKNQFVKDRLYKLKKSASPEILKLAVHAAFERLLNPER